ncbi:CoF synthetase [Paenibacillus sp. NPDC058071]|uniref:CoF synthetase n=1 Tax=Paenibacillus sp. NPDC058071 TaxID=3346326 RepID=UPI0036D86875
MKKTMSNGGIKMRISLNDPSIRAKLEEVCRMYAWYPELLAETECTEWEQLPLLTDRRLLPYYERGEGSAQPEWNVYRTSGTSGRKRKAIYYDAFDENVYLSHKTELFGRLLKNLPQGSAVLSDMGTGHAEATAAAVFEQLGFVCESIPFGLPASMHLMKLSECRPDVLYTMPSLLDGLFRIAPDGFQWGLQKVLLVGEPAPPAWRKRAAELLGLAEADILDTYGSIEIGTIAYYDIDLKKYVLLEGLIAEGASPTEVGLPGVELPEGECVLVLTSLVRRRFPALRFVTYDVVRGLRTEQAEDGSWITTFEAVVKRIGPELKHGEKISVYDIENAVFQHLKQAEVKVLVKNNRLRITIDAGALVDDAVRALIRAELHGAIPEIGAMIRGGLLEEMDVRFTEGEELAAITAAAKSKPKATELEVVPAAPLKRKKLYIDLSDTEDDNEKAGSHGAKGKIGDDRSR